ncbi:uncharacterized protein LOC111877754 isoform X1 [Lactuca sativa]|uniref:uncharacterized protein LOC111877754 isoform X1 n=1 Tax=Lactuca sativa TaxID=4236 RepID=UPI000CB204CD|nr:uncharacterized protein LOC111877754 isoform X1 [Lactuca sativa]
MNSRNKGKRRSYSSSPTRNHRSPTTSSGPAPTTSSSSSGSPPSASVIDAQFVTGDDDLTYLHDLTISPQDKFSNPRSFPYSVKQQCWEKAEKVKGRDPDRWRRDPLGNTIFRKLVGCPGCLCHDYDHILPYSKGGKSTLENCQVLQATVNRSKGNRTEMSRADLIQKSSYCRVSGRDMDLLELSAYGNVRRGQDSGGCIMQ